MLRGRLLQTTAQVAAHARKSVPALLRPLSTSPSSVPPSPASAPRHPTQQGQNPAPSRETTQDALYAEAGPSASTSGGTGEPFPYSQPLASESAAPTPAPEPVAPAPARPLPTFDPEPLPEPPVAPVARVRKPVGAFRGGFIGFLLGLTTIGGYGYFRLLDDYQKASTTLLTSVEELKGSTEQMASHLSRISTLEASLEKLASSSATQAEVAGLRAEYRKLLEAEHVDLLSLKAHVWGLEQDLRNLSKRGTSVRI
ncbi:hypothetical protein JCM10449v2_007840 [Rhodotorula kratochvilovae]